VGYVLHVLAARSSVSCHLRIYSLIFLRQFVTADWWQNDMNFFTTSFTLKNYDYYERSSGNFLLEHNTDVILLFRQLLRKHFDTTSLWVVGLEQEFVSTEEEHQLCHHPVNNQMIRHFHSRGGGTSSHPEGAMLDVKTGSIPQAEIRVRGRSAKKPRPRRWRGLRRRTNGARGAGACGLGAEAQLGHVHERVLPVSMHPGGQGQRARRRRP